MTQCKKSSVSVVLICLNDAHCIADMIQSLQNSTFKELIIVDGGSSDDTKKIAKQYTSYVYTSKRGMLNQSRFGLEKATGDYVFLAECDHIYPENFLDELLLELQNSRFDGIQGTLEYHRKDNFYARGHGLFLEVHNRRKGVRSIIACPQLWRKRPISLLFENLTSGQGFSFDTQRAEICAKLGITVGVGNTVALEGGYIDYKKFKARHRNYGFGDYEFYQNNKKNWNIARKIKSITHVAKTYWIKYPFLSLKTKNPFLAIPYLYLVGLYRYYYWFSKIIRKS